MCRLWLAMAAKIKCVEDLWVCWGIEERAEEG